MWQTAKNKRLKQTRLTFVIQRVPLPVSNFSACLQSAAMVRATPTVIVGQQEVPTADIRNIRY